MTAARPPKPLTARQRDVLLWFAEYQFGNQCPPTVREVGKAFGIASANGPGSLLRPLVAKGWLAFVPRTARGHRLAAWLVGRPASEVLHLIRTAETYQPARRHATETAR